MKTTRLLLSEIVTTAGTQVRAKLCTDTLDDYATAMGEGAEFPPVVVFHDGSRYVLADGFHRVMAASRNGYKNILTEIRKGSKSDALKYALGANSAHGLKRTNADKRRAVVLALAEWPKLADRKLAEICCVDHHTVANVRSEKESTGEIPQSTSRIGSDGRECRLPSRHFEPEPDEEEERPHIKTELETRPKDEGVINKGLKKLDFGKELEHFYSAFQRLKSKCQDSYDYEALDEQLRGMQEESHQDYLAHKSTLKAQYGEINQNQ